MYCLLAHGDTGGDGRILADLFGDAWFDKGASLLSGENGCFCDTDGDWDARTAELKLSIGFASGGDIKLEIGGRRVIVVVDEEAFG